MNKEMKFYIKEFADLYNGKPWLDVTYRSVLNKVNKDIAFKKTGKHHSIAEIVCHVIDYRKFLIAQFEKNGKFDVSQKASFLTNRYNDNWINILKTLEETQNSLIEALNNSGDETFNQKVSHRKYTIKYLLNGIIQHDVYHLGQIMLLLKMYK